MMLGGNFRARGFETMYNKILKNGIGGIFDVREWEIAKKRLDTPEGTLL